MADQIRPHLRGPISVSGTPGIEDANPGELFFSGLLLEGAIELAGELGQISVSDTTILPAGGTAIDAPIDQLQTTISRSICGPINLGDAAAQLRLSESIVQQKSGGSAAIKATAALRLEIEASTVLGAVVAARLNASNSVFTGQVSIRRQQEGCVRFCFVPNGSRTPRRYRCQPDLALSEALETKQKSDPDVTLTTAEREQILARIVPSFTSEHFGHPGFCQLGRNIPDEIFTGADDGSEMGVFSLLKQPQRVANLDASLADYLPLGLEAGVTFAT